MKLRYLAIIMVAVLAFSCNKDDSASITSTFKGQTLSGVYVGGEPVFQFDEYAHQRSINRSKLTFRMQNDAQDKYFSCTLPSLPRKVGDVLNLTVVSVGISIQDGVYPVTLEAMNSGKYWFWCSSKGVGFLVDFNLN